MTVLLVHGVLRARDADAVDRATDRDVDPGTQLRAVVSGSLAAAVSEAGERDLTPEDAVAHLDLLVSLVSDVPVLPLPVGTTAPDDDAVREDILAPAADQLERQLTAVADLVELRLDLTFDTDALVSGIAARDPEVARLAARSRAPGAGLAERMALGETVAAGVADEEARLAEEWTRELADVSLRWTVLHSDENRWRMAYLVPRDQLGTADTAVAHLRAAAQDRAAAEYVGPLPVYSFLDQLPAAEAAQPASRWGW
jgi:hypothetical protein